MLNIIGSIAIAKVIFFNLATTIIIIATIVSIIYGYYHHCYQ